MDRRAWLRASALLASWGVLPACRRPHETQSASAPPEPQAAVAVEPPPPPPPGASFLHGVASGDPLQDRVVLWTRLTVLERPDEGPGEGPDDAAKNATAAVQVRWWIVQAQAADDAVPLRQGVVSTGGWRDYTVKVDVDGLEPGVSYRFGFEALGVSSAVGSTKTLPAGSPERVRMGVASCANLPAGFFNAYAHMAQDASIDVVLHLGDYLYETANGKYGDGTKTGRLPDPLGEALTLADYRARHASYKRDADLQAVHAAHPFIVIWDDHEFANNARWGGARNHNEGKEGRWVDRRAAAVQAYLEWMPLREVRVGPRPLIFRSFAFGDLVDLFMLDTRLVGREAPPNQKQLAGGRRGARILGAAQQAWISQSLADSRAHWRCIGQQVMLTELTSAKGRPATLDTWSGYPKERARLLAALGHTPAGTNVVLTGDIHSSWATELRGPSGKGDKGVKGDGAELRAIELVTPAVSSPGIAGKRWAQDFDAFMARHPQVRWSQWTERGYMIVDFGRDGVEASWVHMATVAARSTVAHVAQRIRLEHGANALTLDVD